MTAYELAIQANRCLMHGGALTYEQQRRLVRELMAARNGNGCTKNPDSRRLYPEFFLPPVRDLKLYRTFLGQAPKTWILAANSYELEILRLLNLFARDDTEVQRITAATLERLKTTCFGWSDDGIGECFDASLVVLRFLITAAPQEAEWIQSRINNYTRHADDRKRTRYSKQYFELCMAELKDLTA